LTLAAGLEDYSGDELIEGVMEMPEYDVSIFDEESAFFEKNRADFVKKALRKYALIKGSRLVGFYETSLAAYEAGLEEFGNVPFFIKEVLPKDIIIAAPIISWEPINIHL